jgi:hypothetical protein
MIDMLRIAALSVLALIGLMTLFWFISDARGDDLRLYDERGEYEGRARDTGDGYRLYDKKGEYQGELREDRNGELRAYDKKGEYSGRIKR